MPAWDAQRVKAKRRGERPSLGLEAKLIGRDEEMTVLKQTLHRVETEGRPALGDDRRSGGRREVTRDVRAPPIRRGAAPVHLLAERADAWRTATRRTRRWRTRSRRSARSWRTIRPRSSPARWTPRSRSCSVTRRSPREIRALVGAGETRPGSPGRTCSRPGGGSWNAWPPGTPWCWRSTTCIGPTKGCSIWWNTSRTGRRGRSCCWCRRARTCSTFVRRGAAASATRPRSTWTR